jgi:hypothetical protein
VKNVLTIAALGAVIAGPLLAWLTPPWYASFSIIMAACFLVGASAGKR